MGRLTIDIDDQLEKELRMIIAQTIGFKKGNLQIAIQQAIKEWIKKHKG
jgi:hypothetical protein